MFLVLLADAAALRAEEAPTWLDLRALGDCPTAASIQAKVVEWLGGPVPTGADLEVRAEVAAAAGGWDVGVELELGRTRGSRRIQVASCADAADFIAITVVLAIDPSRAALGGAFATGAESVLQSVAEPIPEPVPEPVHPVSAPDRPHAGSSPPPDQEAPRSSPRPPRLLVSLGAESVVGLMPSVRVGPTAALGVQTGAVALMLGGSYFPEASEAEELVLEPIVFSLGQARIEGCWLLTRGALQAGPCVRLDLGAMTVGEAAMGGRRTTEPYFALGGGVRGDLQLAPFASAVASIGLIVPVTQPRFILSDGTLIHQPQLGGSATLGVCLFPPRPVTKPGSANTQ